MYNDGPALIGLSLLSPGSRCILNRIMFTAECIDSMVEKFFGELLCSGVTLNVVFTNQLLHNCQNKIFALRQIVGNFFRSRCINEIRAQTLYHFANGIIVEINYVRERGVLQLGGVRNI